MKKTFLSDIDVKTAEVVPYGGRGGAEVFTRLRCSIGRSGFDVRGDILNGIQK